MTCGARKGQDREDADGELYHRLSGNRGAVLQPNFRLYDRAALYTGANLILALQARRPRIAVIAGRAKCSMFATRRRVRPGSVSRRKVKRLMSSRLMSHTVEKYFRREREKAVQSWRPERPNAIERDIGLEAHVQREMPLFLTLRDREGNALTTAMLPPGGKDRGGFRIIIVAASNADPYPQQDAAIAALGAHFGLTLDRHRCFPYGR